MCSYISYPASPAQIEEVLNFLETNGADRIRSWTTNRQMCISVDEKQAKNILKHLKSNDEFRKRFVDTWLPDLNKQPNHYVSKASDGNVKDVIGKAMLYLKENEEMSTLTGILLDVSESMARSIGSGIDEEDGSWAQSIYTVIDDLVKHDVSEKSRVFAIGFGAQSEQEVFDTIGTIQESQAVKSSNSTPATYSTIADIFGILKRHGARNISKWAKKEDVCKLVNEQKADAVLKKLRIDEPFARRFVHDCLPNVCRNAPKGLGKVQKVVTSTVTQLKQASDEDVKKVVEKAIQLMKEMFKPHRVTDESVFSLKKAANIIRGYTNEGSITKQRARELHETAKPYIYGVTPLFSALETAIPLLLRSEYKHPDHHRLLFAVSDGMPTDSDDPNFGGQYFEFEKSKSCQKLDTMKDTLEMAKVTVVGCYISSSSEVEPRTLHSVEKSDWEDGAKFLFKLSSTIATQTVTRAVFIKQGWDIDITNNETKLFLHVNHPDHLREACNFARNIVYSQDALAEFLVSVSLDIYINQKNTDFKAQNQVDGTCYANASAAVLHLAMHRICGRTGGYPDFEKLRDDLIKKEGFEGANTFDVLKEVCPTYGLRCKIVSTKNAMKAVAAKRPVVARFRLTVDEWKIFKSFYEKNPKGILRKDDLDIFRRDRYASTIGHAVVLTSYSRTCIRLMNSWGEEWADNGFFRVENAQTLGLTFIDIYWTTDDLNHEEHLKFFVHGSKVAKKLMKSLKGLQVAEYECPHCVRQSKVTSFSGSLSKAICPKCKGQFSCQDGEGNKLALNMYLTSLSS